MPLPLIPLADAARRASRTAARHHPRSRAELSPVLAAVKDWRDGRVYWDGKNYRYKRHTKGAAPETPATAAITPWSFVVKRRIGGPDKLDRLAFERDRLARHGSDEHRERLDQPREGARRSSHLPVTREADYEDRYRREQERRASGDELDDELQPEPVAEMTEDDIEEEPVAFPTEASDFPIRVGDRVRQARLIGREGDPQAADPTWAEGVVTEMDATGLPTIRWDDGTITSLPADWLQRSQDRLRRRVRAGATYRYEPVLWDQADPPHGVRTGILKPGDLVRVVEMHGAPRANTMGMAYVETVKGGEFGGLVMTNSLVTPSRDRYTSGQWAQHAGVSEDLLGQLDVSPDARERLGAVLLEPDTETWEDAHGLIVGPRGLTLWQAVLAVDATFPKVGRTTTQQGNVLQDWARVPDQVLVARALKHAAAQRAPGAVPAPSQDKTAAERDCPSCNSGIHHRPCPCACHKTLGGVSGIQTAVGGPSANAPEPFKIEGVRRDRAATGEQGWRATLTMGDKTYQLSRLDGETEWTADSYLGPKKFPIYQRGFGARGMATAVIDQKSFPQVVTALDTMTVSKPSADKRLHGSWVPLAVVGGLAVVGVGAILLFKPKPKPELLPEQVTQQGLAWTAWADRERLMAAAQAAAGMQQIRLAQDQLAQQYVAAGAQLARVSTYGPLTVGY